MPDERPLERRAAARTAVVWEALQPLLTGPTRSVVDVGGGTGGFAVRVAELGHTVTVVDPSPDALAAAERRAHERGVVERLHGRQGDLDDIEGLLPAHDADLVLCHDVLGLVADPVQALGRIERVLRTGGVLSLVVGQRYSAVLARAVAGHFADAAALLDEEARAEPRGDRSDRGSRGEGRRFSAAEIADLLGRAGYRPERLQGVRVFSDLVPSTLVDGEVGAVEALLDLERKVASRPEFFPLAAQLHVLAVVAR